VFVISFVNFVVAKTLPATAYFIFQLDAAGRYLYQRTKKRLLAIARDVTANPHATPTMLFKMAELGQGPVYSRRRNFEGVATLYRVVDIQEVTKRSREAFQIVKTNTSARSIDHHAQKAVTPVLDCDKLEPLPLDMGL
jgi:hypothetical protein